MGLVDVYQRSPLFGVLRDADRLRGKCRVWEYRHVCGGSRARTYAVTEDLLAEEPDCDYIPRDWRGSNRRRPRANPLLSPRLLDAVVTVAAVQVGRNALPVVHRLGSFEQSLARSRASV